MKTAAMTGANFRVGVAGRYLLRAGLLLGLLVSVGAPFSADAQTGGMPVIRIRGVEHEPLKALLDGLAAALWQGTRPPESEIILRGRARRHEERLSQALESEGYYAGTISFDISWSDTRPEVVYTVEPGPAYRIGAVTVRTWETPDAVGQPETALPEGIVSTLQEGARARADAVLAVEAALVNQLNTMGYPYAQVFDRRVTVNHDTQQMNVVYFVATGRRVRFGELRITGLETVREETVRRDIVWLDGAWYDKRLVQESQGKLQRSGLFSLARVYPAPAEEATEDGRIPIIVEVAERRHRTVNLGLKYRTDEGIGAGASWEHRNFMNRGRRLRIQGQLTELEQNFGVDYDIQEFLNPGDTLTLNAKIAQLDPDPYRSRRIDVGAWLETPLSEAWSLGFGPALRVSQVDTRRESNRYFLVSFPVQVSVDRRDDRMDALKGYRAVNRITPFLDVSNLGAYFVKNELVLSHFLPLGRDSGFTLATRLRLGIIGGASLSEIPADERFYAGGGGSIRGYAYQKVGPLDRDGNPTGGQSITDMAIELRKRINEQFGAVVFVDGGIAHEKAYFNFGDSVRWGAGAGIRYFTPIGPIRLDVAVPVNRRKDIDSRVQFYISIGQAF